MRSQLVRFEKVAKGENVNDYVGINKDKKLGLICLKRRQKGMILPYVLTLSIFIFLAIFYTMQSFENRNFYLINYKEYILAEDKSHKNKEYLMGKFNKYMEENIDEIKEKTIDVYFNKINVENIFRYDGSFIKYYSKEREFRVDSGHRLYKFVPVIENNNIKYNFK